MERSHSSRHVWRRVPGALPRVAPFQYAVPASSASRIRGGGTGECPPSLQLSYHCEPHQLKDATCNSTHKRSHGVVVSPQSTDIWVVPGLGEAILLAAELMKISLCQSLAHSVGCPQPHPCVYDAHHDLTLDCVCVFICMCMHGVCTGGGGVRQSHWQ